MMHRCYEAEKFKKKIILRTLLSFKSLKNIKNVKFCLKKKVIKKHYLNINYEIMK